jgi:hypothetical protein
VKRVKFIFIILSTFLVKTSFAQENDLKFWSPSEPLQWSDFKGIIDSSNGNHALPYTGVKYTWNLINNADSPKISFKVQSYVSRERSWARADVKNEEQLKHEQLKFDISEFFARKLLEAFNNYHYTQLYKDEINQIFYRITDARQAMEGKYHDQTQTIHSLNKAQQQLWAYYISDLLSHNYTYEEALAKMPAEVYETEFEKYWPPEHPLQWSDFKGPIPDTSRFDAGTNSGIKYSWRVAHRGDTVKITFSVRSFFDKSKSYTRNGRQAPELLAHEQLHFDITDFFARKLLEAFNSHNYTNDSKKEITGLYQQMENARKAMEDKYDAPVKSW